MKRTILLFTTILIFSLSQAQVAINSNGANPNASAMLDISSSNKGLLIPRVYLSSLVDDATIPSPATSLLVYNTNANLAKGVGFYYNAGTPGSPNWQPMQDLVFPFYKGTSTNGSAFTIENFSQNTASTAIKAVAGGAGNALEVSGKMKIAGSGQSPAQGKVLTSDANGNATWEGAIAFKAVGVKSGGSEEVGYNVDKKVAFAVEEYDLGNNYIDAYTSPHSTFTVPVKGIYHFDADVSWNAGDDILDMRLVRKRNGVEYTLTSDGTFKTGDEQQRISGDFLLEAGDQIYVVVWQYSSNVIKLYTWNSAASFSGRLVMKL